MHYTEDDRSIKRASHPSISRLAALASCARHLVIMAAQGETSEQWTRAFVSGTLKFGQTHGQDISPLDILVTAAEGHETEQSIYAVPLNLIDPPQARDPPMVDAHTTVCMNFLRGLTGDRSISPYF